jgi:hypothetical protein
MVGIIGEKAETHEIKEKLAEFIKAHDIAGAKEYFLKQHEQRPDVLMEASDITGELRLAMQIIATADAEYKAYGKSFLEKEDNLSRLIPLFVKLNCAVTNRRLNMETDEDRLFLQNMPLSPIATQLAEKILPQPKR